MTHAMRLMMVVMVMRKHEKCQERQDDKCDSQNTPLMTSNLSKTERLGPCITDGDEDHHHSC